MITNDLTLSQTNTMQFYMNQYTNTSNQIQLIMDKQNDLIKLIKELNEYQFLLVSRQSDLLNSINELNNHRSNPTQPIQETVNQTYTPSHLPTANQRPISETMNNVPRGYYPNLDRPLSSNRLSRDNTLHSTQTIPQTIPQTASQTTSQTTSQTIPQTIPQTVSQSAYDNYLIYTILPEGRTRTTHRSPQTTRSNRGQQPSLATTLLETFLDEFLNPVSTAPTNEQIRDATTSFVYEDISEPVNTSCPISLNTFQGDDTILQINRCRHNYTPSSLLEWFRTNTHCPLCRIDIRESD
jgi:hypothetical protein